MDVLDEKRFPHSAKTRNLVRFAEHLPSETMDASFAGDFGFRGRGSRFSILKSPKSAPGPDQCWGSFARDCRLLFGKLLGLEIAYEGLPPDRAEYASLYNAMNYYRSHIEEYFFQNGIFPSPPVEGLCLIWFPQADQLRVSYRISNRADFPVTLQLNWFSEGVAGLNCEGRVLNDGFEFSNEWEVARTRYRARSRLISAPPRIKFKMDGMRFESDELKEALPPHGALDYEFLFSFSFNDERMPTVSKGWKSKRSLLEAASDMETAYARLPRLKRPFDKFERLFLKAAGTLQSLRFRDYDVSGRPVMTIHAGKTGVNATWFWDTAFTLLGLGVAGDTETAKGAVRILIGGIKEDGTPPCTYEAQAYAYRYQMPILAWGVGHFLAMHPDMDFLRQAYPALSRYVRKWLTFKTASGLVVHPPGGTALDDTLRWNTGLPFKPKHGQKWHAMDWGRMHLEGFEAPDVNSFLYLELRTMAAMARKLGLEAEANHWDGEADKFSAAINDCLYDCKLGVYQDRAVASRGFTGLISNAAFMPLYAGIVPKDRIQKLCRGWLLNPEHFLTPFPFPMVDRSNFTYRPGGFLFAPKEYPGSLCVQNYAHGRSEVFMDFWFLSALHNSGFVKEAEDIALDILGQVDLGEGISECYDSLTGIYAGHQEFMWSSAAVLVIASGYYRKGPVARL